MKKILSTLLSVLVLCFCYHTNARAQNLRNFDCYLFSISYPSSYQPAAIEHAPHMVLKAENGQKIFSLSITDYDFPQGVTAWDSNIYDMYSTALGHNYSGLWTERLERVSIKTRSGTKKFLRLSSHVERTFRGKKFYEKNITYIVIHRGCLIVYCFEEVHLSPFNYPYATAESILSRLRLK